MALLCGLAKPFKGFHFILRNPLSQKVYSTHLKLSFPMTLLGGLPIPQSGFDKILCVSVFE